MGFDQPNVDPASAEKRTYQPVHAVKRSAKVKRESVFLSSTNKFVGTARNRYNQTMVPKLEVGNGAVFRNSNEHTRRKLDENKMPSMRVKGIKKVTMPAANGQYHEGGKRKGKKKMLSGRKAK